jgi:hypothetical protein
MPYAVIIRNGKILVQNRFRTTRENGRICHVLRKIKIFSAYQDVPALEGTINDWLSENPKVRIIQILQTESNRPQGWNLIITILYETG